ncbi:site-specific integrase [Acidicapsa dinghuensis]|uniref:Site-specific integrase n=1 Tax=Acidicapsa dinghuensis TaxID=2218256 RepID=A0ABW1ECX0_9BACT|nr:site-specific integrase [Acidicapsa dinghuensis]
MLSVYTRHHPDCAKKDDSTYRRCRCPKWLDGTLPGRSGRFRVSAKTKSWEKAELVARKYENSALSGEELKPAKMPTVKEAVGVFLGDAEARGLAPATLQKLRGIFQVQLVGFAEESGVTFLREFNPRNLTEWRQTWKKEKELARKKKFERVIGFFWYCVRQGWLRENPTATMGRVIAKHVPTDYFTADEYKRIIDATYRLGEHAERSWAPEKRGIRIRALTELMRWSGLRIRDAVTLECARLVENKLMLYQAKTGTPVFVPLPPHVADLLRSIPPGLKPNPNYFFWSGNGLPKTFVANWQRAYRRLFKVADLHKPDGTSKRSHCHMFRDTFAVEMLLAGVPIDQVSILLGHASVRVTEKHYSPWVRARQDQLEKSVQSAWQGRRGETANAG